MKRAMPTRSVMPKDKPKLDFCALKPRVNKNQPGKQNGKHEVNNQPSDIDLAIARYIELNNEMRYIRGTLYRRGINPDEYLKKN